MATLKLVAGFALLAISVGPLRNLFADYQDSPSSTYLIFGLPPLVIGLVLVVAGFRDLARNRA